MPILIELFKYIFSGQDNVMGLVTSFRIGSSVCLVMPYIKHDHPLVIEIFLIIYTCEFMSSYR